MAGLTLPGVTTMCAPSPLKDEVIAVVSAIVEDFTLMESLADLDEAFQQTNDVDRAVIDAVMDIVKNRKAEAFAEELMELAKTIARG